MNRHLVNFLIFVLAVVLYALGFGFGAMAVVVLAVLVELTFWVRLFRGSRTRGQKSS